MGAGRRARRKGADERAVPGPGLDQPFALQVPVGLEHRIGIDRGRRDHLAHGGELISHPQQAHPQRLPDLLDDLQVRRHHRMSVHPEAEHLAFSKVLVN
jgi:hypothetical protein